MKKLIKSIVPNCMLPMFERLYWKFIDKSQGTNFTHKQYNDLTALKCIIAYNKYGGYCVPESSRHRPAAKRILHNYVYEPHTIEYIISKCGKGDIVHAGTFFGDFLPALSKGCAPHSKIWAFEPNPESYRCAKITLMINDINNVTLTNAGLGAKQESLILKTRDSQGRALGGGSQIISKDSIEINCTESVQIMTIDDVVGNDRNVSIIQLDVEGHEQEALKGSLKTIQRCLPIIILEVLPKSTLLESEWFYENILCHGYLKTDEIHGNVVFITNAEK